MQRSVRRVPRESRCSEDTLRCVRHAPWHSYKGMEVADGDRPKGVDDEVREGIVNCDSCSSAAATFVAL